MHGRLVAALALVAVFVAFPELPHDLLHHHEHEGRVGWFALAPEDADGCKPFLVEREEIVTHGGLRIEEEASSVVERKCPDADGAFRFESEGYWRGASPVGGP